MYPEIIRFAIFGSIGLFNAILDIAIWKSLVRFLDSNSFFGRFISLLRLNNYSFAHIFSFVISVISSYILNKNITWHDTISNDFSQSFKFFGVATFSWILTTLILNFLTSPNLRTKAESIIKLPFFVNHYPTIAKLATILCSMITNYIGYKFFVFV